MTVVQGARGETDGVELVRIDLEGSRWPIRLKPVLWQLLDGKGTLSGHKRSAYQLIFDLPKEPAKRIAVDAECLLTGPTSKGKRSVCRCRRNRS